MGFPVRMVCLLPCGGLAVSAEGMSGDLSFRWLFSGFRKSLLVDRYFLILGMKQVMGLLRERLSEEVGIELLDRRILV